MIIDSDPMSGMRSWLDVPILGMLRAICTGFQKLKLLSSTLDLSFNNIRHSPSLPSLRHVNTLYLVQNKISRLEKGELDWCQDTMKSLELGGNRIRVIENLDKLIHLEELWLGKNKIRVLEVRPEFAQSLCCADQEYPESVHVLFFTYSFVAIESHHQVGKFRGTGQP